MRAGASNILTLDERAATIYRGTLLGSWTFAGPFTLTASYSADYQLGDIHRNLFRDEKRAAPCRPRWPHHRAQFQPFVPAAR